MDPRRLLMLWTLPIAGGLLTLGQPAVANDEGLPGIDAKSRARMAKDKAQQAAVRSIQFLQAGKGPGGECGAANGAVATPTGRRSGAAPGQIFDAAPTGNSVTTGPRCN